LTALLPVNEAQARILSVFHPVETENIPIEKSTGRILAETVRAVGDLPPFANSSMDGFAVQSADVQNARRDAPAVLAVVADIPAGKHVTVPIQRGQAARIMTGAPIPPGADAVVPVEDTDLSPALHADVSNQAVPAQVSIYSGASPGTNIRPRGQDVQQGQILLEKGRKLQPQDVGMLASIGQVEVCVYRRPRVALFSSGDELVQPGRQLEPGQIYDSNQYMLAALLEREGAEVIRLGAAQDRPEDIEAILSKGVAQNVDLLVTSAGVSVGAYDYVRQVIESHGALTFWRVNMRPGKPLAFGSYSGIPLISLPGNPVSAFIGCMVFVLPAIYRLAGHERPFPAREKAILAEPVESDGRESYLRAVVNREGGHLTARLTGHQGSGNLFSLVQANALLILPSGVKSLPSGAEVDVWFIEEI